MKKKSCRSKHYWFLFALTVLFLSVGYPASAASPTHESNVRGNNESESVAPLPQQSKKHTVKGVVMDKTKETVIGASVIIPNTTVGCITNLDGEFTLEVDKLPVTLQVSYVGYKTMEVKVTDSNMVQIIMEDDSKQLEEVVVVGYGTQKKANLSGSVSTVKMDEVLGSRPQPNTAAALQGAIPGLTISSGSNTPGQTGKNIQIRGSVTFSNKNNETTALSPLILIDNVPGDIDALHPEDIESVTVLKDASSAAIY